MGEDFTTAVSSEIASCLCFIANCLCLLLPVFHQGATIRRDEATGAVIVARIMRGGAADRSGETKQC